MVDGARGRQRDMGWPCPTLSSASLQSCPQEGSAQFPLSVLPGPDHQAGSGDAPASQMLHSSIQAECGHLAIVPLIHLKQAAGITGTLSFLGPQFPQMYHLSLGENSLKCSIIGGHGLPKGRVLVTHRAAPPSSLSPFSTPSASSSLSSLSFSSSP
jgi:hypothetical protein